MEQRRPTDDGGGGALDGLTAIRGAESGRPLRECVAEALTRYFEQLDGHDCCNLHDLVIREVEEPLIEAVMRYCHGNQTRAAQLLGINRGTLRKKLVQYGLDR